MTKLATAITVAAAGLAATALIAQQPGRPPHLDGIDTLPPATFQENLAIAVRIHHDADAARVSQAVVDAFNTVGFAGLGPHAAAILDAARRDPHTDAGDVLAAIDRIGGKRVGRQSELAKRHYAESNAYGRAYTMSPAGVPHLQGNPRPWLVSPEIQRNPCPSVECSVGSPAYPSGHTTDGYAQSLLLAIAFPERARQILKRASDYAESRMVLGVHYPLDLIGGRILATSAVVRLLNERSTAFGVRRPRSLTEAIRILRAARTQPCRIAVVCDEAAAVSYPDLAWDRALYRARLTYGMSPVAATDAPAIVPPGAEILLATRFPYLDAQQRREVLATTEIPSGRALDDGSGYARLDLFAAAGGDGAFRDPVLIPMPAGHGVFSNDITGSGRLVKVGKGMLTLAGKNDFTDGITIRGGTIVSDGKGLGQGPIRNDATLTIDASVDARINNVLTGTGRIIKTGAGTLHLTSMRGFHGTVIVTDGRLLLHCSSGKRQIVHHVRSTGTNRIVGRLCQLKTNSSTTEGPNLKVFSQHARGEIVQHGGRSRLRECWSSPAAMITGCDLLPGRIRSSMNKLEFRISGIFATKLRLDLHRELSGQYCAVIGPGPAARAVISAFHRHFIDHYMTVRCAGGDPRRRKSGLVRRIGKLLRLQRDAVAHAVQMAVFADERAVEEIAGI